MSAVATSDPVTIRPLSPALGAEVIGLDTATPFPAETFAQVRQAFDDYHVLCFCKQDLSIDAQLAFSEQFGPLEAFPEKDKTKTASTVYNVANVSAAGEKLGAVDLSS